MFGLSAGNALSLLIVDDDDVDRERIRRMLSGSEQAITVDEASNPDQALKFLESSVYDCILLDFRLGPMSGLDLLGVIDRARTHFSAVVMITGLGDENVAAGAMRKGVSDYLIKNTLRSSQLLLSINNAVHRTRLERRLLEMAHYDALTGLATRTLLTDRLQQAIARIGRTGETGALAFIDLDRFKVINDTYGHEAGDAVLIEVGRRLRASTRQIDTAARLGGDEFVILWSDIRSEQDSTVMLDRLCQEVRRPLKLPMGEEVTISASIGVTIIRNDVLDADTVLRHADQTMYRVKNSGRNAVRFFDDVAEQKLIVEMQMHQEALAALAAEQFRLYYQPKINMRTGEVLGFESLIRWLHPERGLLLPAAFQSTLEQDNFSFQVGDWVLGQAIRQAGVWQSIGLDQGLSVNISPNQLQHRDFLPRLRELLRKGNLWPGTIELEILETAMVKDTAPMREIIEACHDMGVRVALDDFGTGYSSLTLLRQLPIDTVKIDKSFVINMLQSQDDRAIVSAVVDLCNTFGRQVLAEGVETELHIERLLEFGCDRGQGYYFARPMPANEVADWMTLTAPAARCHV